MAGIEKIRDDLYIKKGWDGYRVVYPNRKDLNKPFNFKDNCNWKNILFGGHWSWSLKLLLFLIALYFFVQMYLHDTALCREYVKEYEQKFNDTFSLNPNLSQLSNISIMTLNNLNITLENNET